MAAWLRLCMVLLESSILTPASLMTRMEPGVQEIKRKWIGLMNVGCIWLYLKIGDHNFWWFSITFPYLKLPCYQNYIKFGGLHQVFSDTPICLCIWPFSLQWLRLKIWYTMVYPIEFMACSIGKIWGWTIGFRATLYHMYHTNRYDDMMWVWTWSKPSKFLPPKKGIAGKLVIKNLEISYFKTTKPCQEWEEWQLPGRFGIVQVNEAMHRYQLPVLLVQATCWFVESRMLAQVSILYIYIYHTYTISMDWLKGNVLGNHGLPQIYGGCLQIFP